MKLITPEYSLLSWQVLILLITGMWVWAVVDVLRSDFSGANQKLIWVLVVIFMPFVGTLLYFFIGRANKIKYN